METDPLLEEAKKISLEAGKVSVSWLQRKLRIGYVRAARIMDALTEQGFCEAEFCNEIFGRRIIAAPKTVLHADAGDSPRFWDVATKPDVTFVGDVPLTPRAGKN